MARESSFNASSAVQESKVEKLKRVFLPSAFDFSTFDVRRTAPVGLRRAALAFHRTVPRQIRLTVVPKLFPLQTTADRSRVEAEDGAHILE